MEALLFLPFSSIELPEFLPSFFLFFPVSNFLVSHRNELKWFSKEFLNHKSLKFGTVHIGYKPQDGVALLIRGILLLSSALLQADWGKGDRKWPPAERIRLENRKTLDEISWACFFQGLWSCGDHWEDPSFQPPGLGPRGILGHLG